MEARSGEAPVWRCQNSDDWFRGTASMASAIAIQASCQATAMRKRLFYNKLETGRHLGAGSPPPPKFAIRSFFVRRTINEQAIARAIRGSIPSQMLKTDRWFAILVSMTRITKSKLTKQPKSRRQMRGRRQPGYWVLQDAKARFSELVRRVRSEGPQHVTVHGRDEVVVIAAEEFRRLKGEVTGKALIAAMQTSPYREIDLNPSDSPARA